MLRALLRNSTFSIALWILIVPYGLFWGVSKRSHSAGILVGFYCCATLFPQRIASHPRIVNAFAVPDGEGLKLLSFVEFREATQGTLAPPALAEIDFFARTSTSGIFAPAFTHSYNHVYIVWNSPPTPKQLASLNESAATFITASGQFSPERAPVYADLARSGQVSCTTIHPWYLLHDAIGLLVVIAACVAPFSAARRYIVERSDLHARERRMRRLAAGKCPRCLYDISATPVTCPECGEDLTLHPPPVQGAKAHAPDVED